MGSEGTDRDTGDTGDTEAPTKIPDELKPHVERLIADRLNQARASWEKKAKQSGASADDIARERDELKSQLEKIEEQNLSEVEKAQKRARKAEENAAKEMEKWRGDAEKARSELLRFRLRNEIGAALATLNDRRGEDAIVALTESAFEEDGEGHFVAEDPESGKSLSVKEWLDAWLRQPGREIYQRPPTPGTGQRGGAPSRMSIDRSKASAASLIASGLSEFRRK